jgi:zinc transporter
MNIDFKGADGAQAVSINGISLPAGGQDMHVPGLAWGFRMHGDGQAEPLAPNQPIEHRHDGWLWLHLDLSNPEACRWLHEQDIPVAAADLLAAHENHQQLHASDNCVYGVLSDLSREIDNTGDDFAHLHFVMTERLLISGRYRLLTAVEKVRAKIEGGQVRLPSVAALLENIVDHVADAVDAVADSHATKLDQIENDLTQRNIAESSRQDLGEVRRTSVKLHRQLAGLRTLFHRLERDGTDQLPPPLRIAASKLAQRLDALDHDIVETRERARVLQEEITEATHAASNRALNILTVITTVILPPTLVTGVFGMNTKGLPFTEDPNGFLYALLLMAGSTVGVYWLMRKIGALRF